MICMNNNSPQAPHRQAWDLIPWVVGGSASPAEQLLVTEHVAACPDCREELAFHTALRGGMAGSADAPHDVEPAWERMQARLETGPTTRPVPATDLGLASTPGPVGNRLVRMLVAAVVVQAVGLSVLGATLWHGQRGTEYQTLSQTASTPSVATIRLVPAAELQQAQLQALLKRTGTHAVEINADGSLLGLTVEPAAGHSLDQVLTQLRAEPGVMLAEPMPQATASPAGRP
jgi:anti-sigma factor RsiW